MARMTDWEQEIHDGKRKENWSVTGPNAIVKVLPFSSNAAALDGYITLGKYLLGKTPPQIQHALGLPPSYLKNGATIFRLARLPRTDEYEYELTAKYPDGLAYNAAYSSPLYPPGSNIIHQWRVKKGVLIPVSKSIQLRPGEYLPYDWLL